MMKTKGFSFTCALVKCKVALGVLAGILACGQVGAQDSISGDDVVRRVAEDIRYKEEAVRNVEKYGGYSGGSYESGDSGSNPTTLDEYKKRKQGTLNALAGELCLSCHGYKKCSACGGTKVVHKGGMTYTCTLCNDAGDCPVCHGTGLASWNR